MIKSVTIRNFKSIVEETYDFTDFDLLVGRNNSGKSTVLQAMAIWQYSVDEFRSMKRSGSTGVQIVLPNFSALPVPEFALLWREKTDRNYPKESDGSRKLGYVLIDIELTWSVPDAGDDVTFGVSLRYQSPQTIYAIPQGGWQKFYELDNNNHLPRIVYVPPFSGLEPAEQWKDDGVLKQQVGKGQPGSVLRNLLFRVIDKTLYSGNNTPKPKDIDEWNEIERKIREWFGVTLLPPNYIKGKSLNISCQYKAASKEYDIISGGSGFHQTLTLLAFLYGYPGLTTILFDEPDAHLHTNLQYEIMSYLKTKNKNVQFIIATHSEALIRSIEIQQIVSVLSTRPQRAKSSENVISALQKISNVTVVKTQESPYILYVEGEDDMRILQSWAEVLSKSEILNKFYILPVGGGSKDGMKKATEEHFSGLRQIVPNVKRLMLMDFDREDTYHPETSNIAFFEWKRKNIDNYLLCPPAWKKAVQDVQNLSQNDLFLQPCYDLVDEFYASQNLTLPPGRSWRNVDANIFSIVDGKKILFESADSLFQQLNKRHNVKVNRSRVAANFHPDDLHQDVHDFFERLEKIVNGAN